MVLHILKMAVGVATVSRLSEIQRRRLAQARQPGGAGELRHLTRNTPRRAGEIVDGGSIYWIIKGCIRARQRIVRIERAVNAEGKPRCAFILDPELIQTVPVPHRALQGWRYLPAADAPPDRAGAEADAGELPEAMAAELRALGLL